MHGRVLVTSVVAGMMLVETAFPVAAGSQGEPAGEPALSVPHAHLARTVVFSAAALGIALFTEPPSSARWKGGILLDDDLRDAVKRTSRTRRSDMDHASDITVWMPYLFLAADIGIARYRWGRWHESLHMLANSLESLALTQTLTLGMKNAVGRQRPFGGECASNPSYDPDCGKREENESFPSGHSSTAFAGAGLVCANHLRGRLWGTRLVDWGFCGGSLAAASATAMLRMSADKHYFSDVLVAGAVGFTSGFLLHYGLGRGEPAATTHALVPMAAPGVYGIHYVRRF